MDYSARIEFEDADGIEGVEVITGPTDDSVREDLEIATSEIEGCGGRVHRISWPPLEGSNPVFAAALESTRAL
jgi:hypothetical protein